MVDAVDYFVECLFIHRIFALFRIFVLLNSLHKQIPIIYDLFLGFCSFLLFLRFDLLDSFLKMREIDLLVDLLELMLRGFLFVFSFLFLSYWLLLVLGKTRLTL